MHNIPQLYSLVLSIIDVHRRELGTIRETVPHIFKRPVLSVDAHDPMYKAATFLAAGPQIYADGLVVLDGYTPVGRIGGRTIIKHVLESKDEEWLRAPMSQVMDRSVSGIDAGSSLSYALEVFAETKFAFVPITVNYRIASALSIRDVQRYVISLPSELDGSVADLSSPIVSLREDVGVGKTLTSMVQNNIRNIVIIVSDDGKVFVINDRKMLEFLMSHEGRGIISERGIGGLYDVKVVGLDLLVPVVIGPDVTARRAAEMMSDVCTPCLLIGQGIHSGYNIVTPWDIVMKGFYHAARDTESLPAQS